MKYTLRLAVIIFIVCFFFAPVYADNNEEFRLYQQVITGQKKLEQLTPEQKQQVITIHGIMNRSSCDGCSIECSDAKDQAESYRSDLESYANRLYRCVEGNDLTDDCSSEFRRVKLAHSDFESAVSDVSSNCN